MILFEDHVPANRWISNCEGPSTRFWRARSRRGHAPGRVDRSWAWYRERFRSCRVTGLWPEQQRNGASAALPRRLVDEARKQDPGRQRARLAMDAANRFMSAMAGNLPGYEEACRALYAADRATL